jgi:hypothetical protein
MRRTLESRIQYERVENFFSEAPFRDGSIWTGSVHPFQAVKDLIQQLENNLRQYLSHVFPIGTLPLDDWCRSEGCSLIDRAGPRYSQDAHVETDIGKVFDWLLARPEAIAEIDDALAEVWKNSQYESAYDTERERLGNVAQSFRQDRLWQDILPAFDDLVDVLTVLERRAWEQADAIDANRAADGKSDHKSWRHRQIAANSRDARDLIRRYSALTSKRILLLVGPAGQGKTHTLVHEVQRTLETGGLALGVLCQEIGGTGAVWDDILHTIDYHDSVSSLLDALENEARQRKKRVLIVLDALNQAPQRQRWRDQLIGVIQDILKRPHLVLALSVRSDYLQQTLPTTQPHDAAPWVQWQHPGFSSLNGAALTRYFAHYGVTAPVAPPIGEIGNPLYTQMLAKSMQHGEKVSHWLPSWLNVWKAWIAKLEDDASGRLVFDASRPQPISRTLHQLAQRMLTSAQFCVTRSDADEIAKQVSGVDGVIGFLCSEGALFDRIDSNDSEIIEFSYDRLTDTFIVNQILETQFKGLESSEAKKRALLAAMEPNGILHPVRTFDWSDDPLCHRRAGLLEALCLAVPRHIKCEFPTLYPNENLEEDWQLRDAFNDSLRWRSDPADFGAEPKDLWNLWNEFQQFGNSGSNLDDLLGFALIPRHPFSMERILHPTLLNDETPGARDAHWSIDLIPKWFSEESNLRVLVSWSNDADLHGLQPVVALPAARLLAWTCASSQRGLRNKAIRGLTRVLVPCPAIISDFLPDFLTVNDAYVLESVLIAVWGLVIDGRDPDSSNFAAHSVYNDLFLNRNPSWCHITIRHYTRCIVEKAHESGWLAVNCVEDARPPYKSELHLERVPDQAGLETLDLSPGFKSIVFSCTKWDFFLYVMGGNWGFSSFSSVPLTGSTEPPRPYTDGKGIIPRPAKPGNFDGGLVARFVAWNCQQLGWTAERFNEFDKGFYTNEMRHSSPDGRTERVGKKYQWIGWYTILAFLADNYRMNPGWNDELRSYESPAQLTSVELYDPTRWLGEKFQRESTETISSFWAKPSLPNWPDPEPIAMQNWVESRAKDVPITDLISWSPSLPPGLGMGPWFQVALEHVWETSFAPGRWALDQQFRADIGYRIIPRLIREADFPGFLMLLESPKVQQRLRDLGRVELLKNRDDPIAVWPKLFGEYDVGFHEPSEETSREWFPVPWMEMVGEGGGSDPANQSRSLILPWPRLFREWQLDLDLGHGVVNRKGEPLFALPGWELGERSLVARLQPMHNILAESKYKLVWIFLGERRAFLDFGMVSSNKAPYAWVDLNGIAFLAENGRAQVAWYDRVLRSKDGKPIESGMTA